MRDIGRTVLYTVCGVTDRLRLDTDEEIIKNASPQTIDPITADQRGHNKRNRMFTIGHPRVLENKRTVNNEHTKKNCTWSIETHHTCVSQFIEVVFPPQADPIETQGSTIKQHNHTCMVTLD